MCQAVSPLFDLNIRLKSYNLRKARSQIMAPRRATQDSEAALKMDQTYIKAVIRGVRSQQKLGTAQPIISSLKLKAKIRILSQ